MSGHVALVCSRARRPARFFLEHPAIDRLSVLTEDGHVHDYGPDVTVVEVADVNDPEQVRRGAAALSADGDIDAVLAPYEVGLPAAGYLRSYFDLPGPGYDTVCAFTNKYVMKRRFVRAGLPVTPFRAAYSVGQAHAAAAELGWPCVVKPAFGGGSMGVALVGDSAELDRYLAGSRFLADTGGPLLVEAFVPMAAEYHCDGVVHDGEVVFAAPSRYFDPLLGRIDAFTGSYQLPPSHGDHAEVRDLHRRAVAALGLRDGVTHLEVFRTDEGFLVSEIACRPAGGGIPKAVALQHGVDLLDACVRTSLGVAPAPAGGVAPGDYFVNCDLPIRPGRITELSAARDLAGLPGVVAVDMLHRVGDVVARQLYSASATGIVHYRAADESEVFTRLKEIQATFTLRVEEEVPS